MKSLSPEHAKIVSDKVESNTGRTLAASFQGNVSSNNITVMEVNGSTIYFRGECTNVLVVNQPLDITITSAKSLPIVIPVSIGGTPSVAQGDSSNPIFDKPRDIVDTVSPTNF